MRRGSPLLDLSIPGDELEHHRIALEHTLRDTDISLRLSSNADDDDDDDNESVEYPRHNSMPSYSERSFIRRDWEYRPDSEDDDDNGISPYSGRTVSTAAHHASAVTLNAGLTGRRRRDRDNASMSSGAEFDPDRPLRELIAAGAEGKMNFSMFDADSRATGPFANDDVTVELDRVLQSGLAQNNLNRSTASSSSSSSSGSESPSRAKLSDALSRVSFSPKRPRTGIVSPRSTAVPLPLHRQPAPKSPLVKANQSYGADEQTPRPPKRHSHSQPQPEVRLQPPTPTRSQSDGARRHIVEAEDRNPFHDVVNHPAVPPLHRSQHGASSRHATSSSRNQNQPPRDTSRSRLHLPDVTGLTSAVESPAKLPVSRFAYSDGGESREAEARLVQTLLTVQSKLTKIEDENRISKRRIRELEYELEICKEEVTRERNRVMNPPTPQPKVSKKGKGRVQQDEDPDMSIRYKEAVEEKKALEALLRTLNTHVSRLSTELSSHQKLLLELKGLRDADARSLKEKSREIVRLKEEVERLSGEVEVLKGVVEDGLKERQKKREEDSRRIEESVRRMQEEDESMGLEYLTFDEQRQPQQQPPRPVSRQSVARAPLARVEDALSSDEEEEEVLDPRSIPGSSRLFDKTMRTDHATLGSSIAARFGKKAERERFIGDQSLERIETEVSERRSDRSRSNSGSSNGSVDGGEPTYFPPPSEQGEERPIAPTPRRGSRASDRHHEHAADEPPFPKIRGSRLEKLFFQSEHNVKTCSTCQRRRRRPGGAPAPEGGRPLSPGWLPSRLARTGGNRRHRDEEEDEGFVEGSENADHEALLRDARRGKQKESAGGKKLPAQTVLMNVIREMEGDFGHYKSVYVELAEQYKIVDAASDVAKRNLVAQHLREVIDIIEQKGDQIASLYDLLEVRDGP